MQNKNYFFTRQTLLRLMAFLCIWAWGLGATAQLVSTLAGTAGVSGSTNGLGTAAKFHRPYGVAVDASGNVYVADYGNHLIRKIDAMGNVTTLAGTAGSSGSTNGQGTAAKFNGPVDVAVDASGNVYVADFNNHLIRKIDAMGNVTTLAGTAGHRGSTNAQGTAAKFNSPVGVAVDASGNVYVAEQDNHLIRKIDAMGNVTTLAGTAGVRGSDNGQGTAAKFYSPFGVAVDASGNVYVADYNNHLIRKIDAMGNVTTLAGTAGVYGSANAQGTAAKFNNPAGVAVDASGNVYVADLSNDLIRKIAIVSASLSLGSATQPTNCTTPNGSIAFSSSGITAGEQTLNYKIGSTATNSPVTVAADGSFSLTGLGAGVYSEFAIGSVAATGSITLNAPSYSFAIGSGTNPTTCSGTNGSIRFTYNSGSIPNGSYTMSYLKGTTPETKSVSFVPSPVRISAGASAPLTATLSGLGAGSYSNFKITVNGCEVTATGSSPVVLSDPTLPTFAVGTKINPTTCGGNDGSIALTGLTASTSYSVSYQKDGAAATVTTLSSNASGVLTIPSLTAGSYTNITVTLGNCTSAASSTTLSNPSYAISIGTATNPTTCGGTNGSIRFASDNVATGTYPISFSKDMSTVTGTITFTSPVRVGVGTSISKSATLSGLSAGSYSNFKITVNGCEVTAMGTTPVNLSGPTVPTFSIGTLVNPTTCGNTNGSIPLTGLTASKSYSVSYQKDGGTAVVSTLSSNASGVLTLSNLGAGSYTNITVTLETCSSVSATASLSNPASATASISGTTSVCQNASNPVVIFTGANGTAPYTFTYRINGGAVQTLTTTGTSSSAFISQSTSVAGVYRYQLESVNDAQSCGQNQTGSATVTVQGKPTVGLSIQQVNLGEGNTQTFCDTDTNPVNPLQLSVSSGCVAGNPLWRVQVGNGAWSEWSATAPVSQSSNNQVHRYQAACDANCPNSYSTPISVTINYRASTPQNVSMVADGTTVVAGEEKSICDQTGNALTFNATCATGESLIYSVDGSVYLPTVPTQMVDGQYHNYRVRCQKTDGTVSCVETASGVMRLKISAIAAAPVASLNVTSGCGTASSFSGTANCNGLTTVWYNATTNAALPNLPTTTPNETTSYYARCQGDAGCQSEKSNTVTFTVVPVNDAPMVSVSSDLVCTGTEVTVSTSCPSGASALWNTGVTGSSFKVAFGNVTTQDYSAKCVFENGCQSPISATKTVRWKGFELTIINIGQSKSAIKTNDRAAWASQFVTADAGPSLDNSTESNPTLYYSENVNKTGPRYWTIHADACALGTSGSMTFDMLATPETGVVRSFNTHENNAPYFMYANREGYTELYAQNHPAYGFFLDNGSGVNVYDEGLPKGLYKLGVRYWDQKGWGSIFPSTRKPQGSVLAYQEYWFRIQSKDGIGTGAARVASDNNLSPWRFADAKGLNPLTFAEIVPNPVSSVLRLKVTDAKAQKVNVSLLDASGRTLLQRGFVPETNTHQEEFNVSDMANGMYFLKVNAGDKQATLKVVKVE